jgi:hypothetical protein
MKGLILKMSLWRNSLSHIGQLDKIKVKSAGDGAVREFRLI